jgi:hypothetical protein
MRYEGESPQIPTGEAWIRNGRIGAELRSAGFLTRLRLPDDITVTGITIDLDRLANGLDLIAGNPIRDGHLYLRSIGGLVHNLREGFASVQTDAVDIPVTQADVVPADSDGGIEPVLRRGPGRPPKPR